jgi:4-aminobutyrate aminotransferase-like enzyme
VSHDAPALGSLLPEIRVPPPGPASRSMAERLARVESRNVTFVDQGWPVFWQDARGANVRDADGNVYIDMTSAFGVALLGHRSPAIEFVLHDHRLVHGMGDIHPPVMKLELLERLAKVAPWDDARILLANTGSEAVEAALKTTALATGRPGVLAFEGAYHGLTLGALSVTRRDHFRAPFAKRVYEGVAFAPFPDATRDAEPGGAASLRRVAELLTAGAPNGDPIGTIIIEPVQARGGARIPPNGFMAALSDLASERGVLIIADEIFTGLGRCGSMFASTRVGLRPDVICSGKALGAGLPLSACAAPARVMDAWPKSTGEAIHTSTFLGHPLACAAGVAVLDAFDIDAVPARAERVGEELVSGLRSRLGGCRGVGDVRGLGLLIGVEFVESDGRTPAAGAGSRIAERALREGILVLPAGDHGEVLELSPPIVLTTQQVDYALDVLASLIREGV